MPKVSSQYIRIDSPEIGHLTIAVDVFYTSEHKFYIFLPDEYQQPYDLLSEAEAKKLKGKGWSKTRYGNPTRTIIWADTENECVEAFHKMINRLVTMSLKKRDVIIVLYCGSHPEEYNTDEPYNREHDEVKVEFSFIRCTETTAGKVKDYAIHYERRDVFNKGKMEKLIRKVDTRRAWGNQVIVDDTPENREFLERIYAGLVALNEKLMKFTASESDLLQLISSGQKLLGSSDQNDTI